MKYENIKEGIFISRPNRFIAYVMVDGKQEICHVKNTGRCTELLYPGVRVFLEHIVSDHRKTKYDLICVEKDGEYINIDSQAPNRVFEKWVEENKYFGMDVIIKREVKYNNSRFDFYIEKDNRKIFVEVKGVTLKEGKTALFPDAPTQRGVKHLNELISCIKEGYEAYVFFIIQMKKVSVFSPNKNTHPEFASALLMAQSEGVKIFAIDCNVTKDSIDADCFVDVVLQ